MADSTLTVAPDLSSGIITAIGDVADATAGALKLILQRSQLSNTPEMLARAKALYDAAILAQAERDLALAAQTGDLTKVRLEASQ